MLEENIRVKKALNDWLTDDPRGNYYNTYEAVSSLCAAIAHTLYLLPDRDNQYSKEDKEELLAQARKLAEVRDKLCELCGVTAR